jgi:hypothetical protein
MAVWNENPAIPRCGDFGGRTSGKVPWQYPAGRGTEHYGLGRCLFHMRDQP